jgi:DHA1 family inner membrane transport protein
MPLSLFALFLAAFAVGTNELIIAGLLPALARDLEVSIPSAGLLISGYAICVAVGGPILAIFTSRLPRKPLLVGLMAIFVAGNVLCAFATSYWFLMAARLVISCSHGLFFGVAMIIATRLVPTHRQSSAVALVVAGFTVANLLGAPIGTAIGNAFGWRSSFWAIATVGVVVTLAMAAFVPSPPAGERRPATSLLAEIKAAGRQPVLLSYLMIALLMTGTLAVFSYIVPILTTVTGLSVAAVPWILFASGLGGIIGNLVGGRLGDWKPMPALIAIFALEIAICFVLLAAVHRPLPMTVTVFVWSAVGLSFAAPVQGRILKWSSDAPNLASTLISTAFNIGIAAGAWLGGLALDGGWSYADLPWIGVLFGAAALAVAIVSFALEKRSMRPAPVAVLPPP